MTLGIVLGNLALFGLIGVVLNWGFLLLSAGSLASPAGRGVGGIAAFGAMPVALAVFGVGFPLLYLFLGQQHARRSGLRHLYHSNKECVYALLIERLDAYSARDPEKSAALARACERATRLASLTGDLPRMARLMLTCALNRARFREVAGEIWAEMDAQGASDAALGATLTGRLDEYVRQTWLETSLGWLWALLAGNAAAICAAAYWLRQLAG